MKLFKTKHISYYFNDQVIKIVADIKNMKEDQFMSIEPQELAENKTAASQLKHLHIDFTSRAFESSMYPVSAEKHPQGWDVEKGESYPRFKASYSYTLPSESELLSYHPQGYMPTMDIEAKVAQGKLVLEYQTFYGQQLAPEEKEDISNWRDNAQNEMTQATVHLNQEIDIYNAQIGAVILRAINERRRDIEGRRNQDNELN